MKVVLFCGGAGMRLRGYADDVPKPMVQIGTRPIMWHLMKYYAHFGHKDFILCLGYKGNCIKDYFLHYDESVSNNFVWSKGGKNVEFLNRDMDDWTITFVETGANANIGRAAEGHRTLCAGRRNVSGELWRRIERCSASGDGGQHSGRAEPLPRCCWCSLPRVSTSSMRARRELSGRFALSRRTDIWINGGFFAMRKEIFRYIQPGEELVREPFQRLIDKQALLAHKYNGFWQCMDTFKDKQHLEELNQGAAPWKVWNLTDCGLASNAGSPPGQGRADSGVDSRMMHLKLGAKAEQNLKILCLGAHSDDIEIGCGGTILRLVEEYPECEVHWVVFNAIGRRESEARRAAELFAGTRLRGPLLKTFQDGFMPFVGSEIKIVFEKELKQINPDLIFTHNGNDAHQDHRLISQLTWNTFRDHFILEYEIPKYDGDLGRPSFFVPLEREVCEKKVGYLMDSFPSQQTKRWFEPNTFYL